MNDAACDPQGRFWAGTMADDHHASGGALYRMDRNGPKDALRRVVTIAARQTTCCTLAGPGMGWLHITTATEGWTNEQRRSEPTAGVVYRVDPGHNLWKTNNQDRPPPWSARPPDDNQRRRPPDTGPPPPTR